MIRVPEQLKKWRTAREMRRGVLSIGRLEDAIYRQKREVEKENLRDT